MRDVDPAWHEDRVRQAIATERTHLAAVLGRARAGPCWTAHAALAQAIPLAQLDWRVTGTDSTPAVLADARARAGRSGVSADSRVGDMRELDDLAFTGRFELVVSCMALDNILSDDGIRQAVQAMHDVLRPGGRVLLQRIG